jgi:hypothetical protein
MWFCLVLTVELSINYLKFSIDLILHRALVANPVLPVRIRHSLGATSY